MSSCFRQSKFFSHTIFCFFRHYHLLPQSQAYSLMKRGKGLIFTPTSPRAMEGYIITKQSFLCCSRTQRQNHGAFNFTSLKDTILQLSCLSVYAICWCIALITHVVASLCNFYYNFGKLWCSKAHMSHNEFHCRTSITYTSHQLIQIMYIIHLYVIIEATHEG